MPQVGQYTYPNLKLSRAIEIAKRISDDFKGQVSVSGLATALEMAEKGGGYLALLAGLRDYGIVDGRKEVSITETAERILFPATPEEGANARTKAFFTVDLFRKLSERLDGDVPSESHLRAVVQEITRESLTAINSKLPTIRAIWADGIQVIGGRAKFTEATRDAAPAPPSARPGEAQILTGGDRTVEFRINQSYVRVNKDPSEIDLVIRLLTVVREQLVNTQVGNGTDPLKERASEVDKSNESDESVIQ